MAPEFDRRTPVLAFQPKPPSGQSLARNYVLWPVLGYQVVAPESLGEEMDILQKAVLGLCRAGVRTAVEQAIALTMHQDLIAYVMDGLIQAGHVTGEGRPTTKGLSALEFNGELTGELVTGWVLQDPWTRELWPRFFRDLSFFETELVENHVELILGTPGKPESRRTFSVFPSRDVALRTPSPEQVLEAVRVGAKARRFQEQGGAHDSALDNEDTDETISQVVTLDDRHHDVARISSVLEVPRPFFIATLVYLPRGEAVRRWEAVSPFSPRPNPRLRAGIAKEAKHNKGLMSWIGNMAGDAYAKATPDEVLRLAEADAANRVAAALPNLQRLQLPASEVDSLVHALGIAEEDAMKVGERPERGRSVAREAGWVLERFAGILNDSDAFRHFKAGEVIPKGSAEEDYRDTIRPLLTKSVRELTSEPAPPGLIAGSRPKNLRNALQPRNRESARPRMAAMVLHAKFLTEHPLRLACKRDPQLIVKYDRVYQARNDASHDVNRAFSYEEARSLLRDTYEVLERLAEGWIAAQRLDQQLTETR